jgi:outer membrane murein-binding lipoprotein Lpp
MMHFAAPAAAPAQVADTSALDASVARIDADLVALKANVEHTSKTGLSQSNRANDRLDKLEKAQAEPMAKIAKLSESVDKLRATPPAAPVQAAAAPAPAKETTGSIAPTQVATAAAAPAPAPAAPKTEIGRLPKIEGWRLRSAANGGALIEGRDGLYEVYPGDPIPGIGRVDAIRRQDGRMVVVTSKGLIDSR